MSRKKPKANSRAKGTGGELEVRDLLRAHGFEARRGQQFSGGGDSPDVVHNIPNVHIEVKRVEAFSLYKAIEQAEADAPEAAVPVVFHRRSTYPWLVIMTAEDYLNLMEDYHRG